MDTSRTPTSADDQQKTRTTTNHAHANQYHQKPPSFNHKQVNISLVDDGSQQQKKVPSEKKATKNEKQPPTSGEWRESIPIKLEHLLFNFKENSLKVYKQSPPRIMQIFALIAALLLFCGVLALVLSQQRDDNLKKANLPSDQSAVAERIIGESQLLGSHKLKNSLFESKINQTGSLGDKSRKYSKSDAASKDAAVRKAFGSLLFSGPGDDNDEIEPDQEENSSDESFDGERSRSRNFNLFLSDNDHADEKNNEQTDNPKVMFIERLMGLHFGMQPKFGMSESLVIRKTIGGDENTAATDEQPSPVKSDSEIDLLFNGRAANRTPNSNKVKEPRNEDLTPILRYAAAAMLSRVLATAQQQAYMAQLQQQQQRLREMNEKFSSPYRGYRMMREQESPMHPMMPMYGRPMHPPHKHHQGRQMALPYQPAQYMGDRGFSRGPLNEEAESQQIHPIILMLNIPYGKEQQAPAAANHQFMIMGANGPQSFAHPAIETSIQPILMPSRQNQNPYYKSQRQEPTYSSPFVHKNPHHHHHHQNYYSQNQHQTEGYYPAVSHNPYNMQHMNRPAAQRPPYNRIPNAIELPIEIHHQVAPSSAPNQAQAQIIVQPQIEAQSQPNESNDQDQSGENEHHMVVFYDADNVNHSEENGNSPNQPPIETQQQQSQQPQQAVFVKESKQINNDLEKANQISKMLLLHFVNPQQQNQSPVENAAPEQQQAPQNMMKPFLINQQEPQEKPQLVNSKLEEMTLPVANKPQIAINQNKPEIKSEEETAPSNDQRDEQFEKSDAQNNPSESETEQSPLAQFVRHQLHVIDRQQEQRPIQPQQPTSNPPQLIQPVRKEIQIENSNKETEKTQESIQSPAFAMLVREENDEN